ncbi:MAG: (2Fe-2S)-binding protein [Alphaproteobacteria bacterium]|nr:(2Fe-2S)-binding protein [Alphaproteobacteria bacterium]
MAKFTLNVNGKTHQVDAEPDTPLLWVLRDNLKMTGTKFGCGIAQCGACTVHVDGEATRSCVTPVEVAADSDIVTIEGITGAEAKAIQEAWVKHDVPQCGYCQSGQVMSAVALLRETPQPGDAEIDDGMSGNICRCATYVRIRQAIKTAAQTLKG